MLIETQKMAVRRLTGLSSTYMDAIYESLVTMRGGGTTLYMDFNDRMLQTVNYTFNSNRTLTGSASAETTDVGSSATWVATGATSDMIIVGVGAVSGSAGETFGFGAGPADHMNANTDLSASISLYRDAAADDITEIGGTGTAPSAGDNVVIVATKDQGNDVFGYGYNLTLGAEMWDHTGDGGANGVTGAITPNADKLQLKDWTTFYGGMCFEFSAGALPSTWKADMLAMARTLVAEKT